MTLKRWETGKLGGVGECPEREHNMWLSCRLLWLLAMCVPWVASAAAFFSRVVLVQTAQGTNDRLTPQDPPRFLADFASPITLTVTATRKQQLVGFGGAFTEASAIALNSVDAGLREQVLEAYFGEDGVCVCM